MKPSIFKVHNIDNGSLYIMPRPSPDWLIEDASYFKTIGINTIVSLLEPSEADQLGLVNEREILNHLGIEFMNFGIEDRGVPSIDLATQIIASINNKLNERQNVSIHCRAGIGRTGLMTSCVLITHGFSADEAMTLVSSARGITIPDTAAQVKFIYDFEYYFRQIGAEMGRLAISQPNKNAVLVRFGVDVGLPKSGNPTYAANYSHPNYSEIFKN